MTAFHDLRRAWRRFRSRPAAERARLVRALLGVLRTGGPAAVVQKIRGISVPDAEAARYLRWCAAHTPGEEDLQRMREQSSRFAYQPLISILTPAYDTEPALLHACADSVMAQSYPIWEWHVVDDGSPRSDTRAALERIAACDARIKVHHLSENRGISEASNVALNAAAGDYIALLDHDDALLPHALFRMVATLNQSSGHPDVLYSDEDKLDLDGRRCDAYFKPDWSPDLFLSSMYVCHFLVVRRALALEVGGFRREYDYAQDYDLMLRLMDKTSCVQHVPDVLYHWRKTPQSSALVGAAKPTAHVAAQRALQQYLDRNGIPGHVEEAGAVGLHRVRYHLQRQPLVSIVVPSSGERSKYLGATLRALDSRTAYRSFEVVIVSDGGGVPSDAGAHLERLGGRVLKAEAADVSWSARANLGAASARGEHLLVLEEGVQPLDDCWLEAMLELSQRPGIGAVGAKLLDASGALYHVGLVLGLNGVVGFPFQRHHADTVGYFAGAIAIRNYSAVSGACLMTRREVFDRAGGFDERLPMYHDVDYCLKVGDAALRVVFTPYARLVHRAAHEHEANTEAAEKELRSRWGDRLRRDPCYNPNLTREFLDYRVGV